MAAPASNRLNEAHASASFYSSLGSTYEDAFGHNPGLLTFLQKLLPRLTPGSRVLDLGCGTGTPVATTLAAAGHQVEGVDISDEMIRLSRIAVPSGTFAVGDMRTYVPATTAPLDAVLCILSLFVLTREEIEAQVARCSGHLAPGGLLCICTIAVDDIDPTRQVNLDADGRCARDIDFRFMGTQVEITLFTKDGWKDVLGEHGLQIVDTHTELFSPPPNADSEEEMHYFLVAKKIQ